MRSISPGLAASWAGGLVGGFTFGLLHGLAGGIDFNSRLIALILQATGTGAVVLPLGLLCSHVAKRTWLRALIMSLTVGVLLAAYAAVVYEPDRSFAHHLIVFVPSALASVAAFLVVSRRRNPLRWDVWWWEYEVRPLDDVPDGDDRSTSPERVWS